MRMKTGDVLTYKDSDLDARYGTGVVTAITSDEYTILWSGRGLTKYRRSILDDRLERVFQRTDRTVLPKERHLHLGASKDGVPFNENYDRTRIATLCEQMKSSGRPEAKDVADGLSTELLTKKLALREAARAVLLQLAELCSSPKVCAEARSISKELFFGYVIQKSDFRKPV